MRRGFVPATRTQDRSGFLLPHDLVRKPVPIPDRGRGHAFRDHASGRDAMPHPSVAEKRATFRKLHESGCWMIPNPWDVGSARYLQGLGFKALASTSSGFAWSEAYADNAVGVDMVLAHLKESCDATD